MLGLSHPGAAELAARLVEIAPSGLSRVFYSDSGSTAVEVALKMAFQYWQHRGGQHVGRPRSSASRTPTTGTRSARSRSVAFLSSTRPSHRSSSRHTARSPATSTTSPACSPCARRRSRRWFSSARAGRGGDAHPPARVPARRAAALRPSRGAADLRRGRHGSAHRDDVRLRAGGRLAGPALPREGPHRWLSAARRDASDGADLRGVPGLPFRVCDPLPRPYLHRQSARLRRGARLARRLRPGADARPAAAQDPLAHRVAAAGRAHARGQGGPPVRPDGGHRPRRA